MYFLNIYYRPQTKFAKVMFSQVSVCPRGGVPGQVPPPPGRYTPQAGTPRAGTPPGRYAPPGRYTPRQVHPLLGRYPPAGTPQAGTLPATVHAGIRSTSGRYASHWNAFLFMNGISLSSCA